MKKFLKINNKSQFDLERDEELFHSLGSFAQKQMGFHKPPTLNLMSDEENSSKALGKTAYYDPSLNSVTIYTDNRHVKDILRSLAHELVHHTQNENGTLDNEGYHGEGYAQKNKNLRQSEREAYLKGNMCFRDWEDTLKQSKPTIYNEWRINNMSTKEWKNKELMENLSGKFGFKMDLGLLTESSCGDKEEMYEEKEEKPDFPDIDNDGDTEEPISKAQKDKEEAEEESEEERIMEMIKNEIFSQLEEAKKKSKPKSIAMISRMTDKQQIKDLIEKYLEIAKEQEDKYEDKGEAYYDETAEDFYKAASNLKAQLANLRNEKK